MTYKEELEQNYKLLLLEVDKIVPHLEEYAVEIASVDVDGFYPRWVKVSHHEGYSLYFEKERGKDKIKVSSGNYPKFENTSFHGGRHECTFTPRRNPETIANHIKRSMLEYYNEYHKKVEEMQQHIQYVTKVRENIQTIVKRFPKTYLAADGDNHHLNVNGVTLDVYRDYVNIKSATVKMDKILQVLELFENS